MKKKTMLVAIAAFGIGGPAVGSTMCIDFEELERGTVIDAAYGVVLPAGAKNPPYLQIWADYDTATVIETGADPWSFTGSSDAVPFVRNNCLEDELGNRLDLGSGNGTARGFGDPAAARDWQRPGFEFAFGGELVDRFSLKMFDYGDENPQRIGKHEVILQAYDQDGNPLGAPAGLWYSSEPEWFPRSSDFGDLSLAGDACTANANLGHPGYREFVLEQPGIAAVRLTMPVGYDPRVGFDSVCISSESLRADCSGAVVTPEIIWPPNHKMVPLSIDVGEGVTVTATEIWQDEPTGAEGARNTLPDGQLRPLAVRAERGGSGGARGDGRTYHVFFTATDGLTGESCEGEVLVCVPQHQQAIDHTGAKGACTDAGPLYDSLGR